MVCGSTKNSKFSLNRGGNDETAGVLAWIPCRSSGTTTRAGPLGGHKFATFSSPPHCPQHAGARGESAPRGVRPGAYLNSGYQSAPHRATCCTWRATTRPLFKETFKLFVEPRTTCGILECRKPGLPPAGHRAKSLSHLKSLNHLMSLGAWPQIRPLVPRDLISIQLPPRNRSSVCPFHKIAFPFARFTKLFSFNCLISSWRAWLFPRLSRPRAAAVRSPPTPHPVPHQYPAGGVPVIMQGMCGRSCMVRLLLLDAWSM